MSSVEAKLKPDGIEARALECVLAASRAKRQRTKKSPRTKTPDDCPHCYESATANTEVSSNNAAQGVPSLQLKSKRGWPKRSLTEGYCCHNPECDYQGIRDSGVHALVADGDKLTGQGLIKQIKCQWCKFLVTRDMAMYCSKLSVERVGEINRGLAEGLSNSACARVFGHSCNTIQLLHGIHCAYVQMDELHAKLKGRAEAIWTWVSMEVSSP